MRLFVKICLKIKKKIFLKVCLNYLLKNMSPILSITSVDPSLHSINKGPKSVKIDQVFKIDFIA